MEGSSYGEGIHHKMEEGLRLVVGTVEAVGAVFGLPVGVVQRKVVEEVVAAAVVVPVLVPVPVPVPVPVAAVVALLELGCGQG